VASVNASGEVDKKIEVIVQEDKIKEMNQKVQDAIDGKLQDAFDKIEKNKNKIRDGKDTLSDKQDQAADKLAKGEAKLNQSSEKMKKDVRDDQYQSEDHRIQRKRTENSRKAGKDRSGADQYAENKPSGDDQDADCDKNFSYSAAGKSFRFDRAETGFGNPDCSSRGNSGIEEPAGGSQYAAYRNYSRN